MIKYSLKYFWLEYSHAEEAEAVRKRKKGTRTQRHQSKQQRSQIKTEYWEIITQELTEKTQNM
jgi:hypothetical protein